MKRIDLVGQKFGNLIVLKLRHLSGSNQNGYLSLKHDFCYEISKPLEIYL